MNAIVFENQTIFYHFTENADILMIKDEKKEKAVKVIQSNKSTYVCKFNGGGIETYDKDHLKKLIDNAAKNDGEYTKFVFGIFTNLLNCNNK